MPASHVAQRDSELEMAGAFVEIPDRTSKLRAAASSDSTCGQAKPEQATASGKKTNVARSRHRYGRRAGFLTPSTPFPRGSNSPRQAAKHQLRLRRTPK